MATRVETIELTGSIRVAMVIERGKIKPVWFEQTDKPSRERLFIKEVCSVGHHMAGATKIIDFCVYDGANTYKLSLNTRDFTWQCGIAVETAY